MKSKFIKLSCVILSSLFVCIGSNAFCGGGKQAPQHPNTTYAKILHNMDDIFTSIYSESGHPLTDDPKEIALALWASEIMDTMRARDLTKFWLNYDVQANREIISQVFEESLAAMLSKPSDSTAISTTVLKSCLQDTGVQKQMKSALGLI